MIQYCVFVFLGVSIHHWFSLRLSILFDGYLWPTKTTFWITMNHQSTCGWVFARFCKYTVCIYIYIHLILWPYLYIIWCPFCFYQEMTWTTRQRKSVSVVLSKRLFMAYSAKITPQGIAEKVCCDEPESQKQGSARWVGCHAKIMGDQECMCRYTWVFQGCRTQQHLPRGWNCMEFWHVQHGRLISVCIFFFWIYYIQLTICKF